MTEIRSLLDLATRHRIAKNYNDAMAIYQLTWPENRTTFTNWDCWSYGQCLKETGKYDEGLEFCRAVWEQCRNFENYRQLYAWCIYYTQFSKKNNPSDEGSMEKGVNGILQLVDPYSPYSPATRAIFKFIKHLSAKIEPDWKRIGNWLSKLEPGKLNIESYSIKIPGKKALDTASDREEWYSYQTKYLLQTQQWQKCIDTCEEATRAIDKWHYSNDIWFDRRKAAAFIKIGKIEEAKKILIVLVAKKREWFIIQDLAEITSDNGTAMGLFAEACQMRGDVEKKLRLYWMVANKCLKIDLKEQAQLHFQLCRAIRLENQWIIPRELQDLLAANFTSDQSTISSISLIKQLNPIWQSWRGDNQTRNYGTILTLLGDRKSGFVKDNASKKTFYFHIKDWDGRAPLLELGDKINFFIAQGFDAKKQKIADKAVSLRKM